MGCCDSRGGLEAPDLKAPTPHHSECAQSEGLVEPPHTQEYQPLAALEDASPKGPAPRDTSPKEPVLQDSSPQEPKSPAPPPDPAPLPIPKPKSFDNEVMMLKDREMLSLSLTQRTEEWINYLVTPALKVQFLPGSKYARTVPVSCLYVDFEVAVDYSTVLEVLEHSGQRKRWDPSISSLEITPIESTEYETCYTKFNLFLIERCFVERRRRHYVDEELHISFFSAPDERYPASPITGETFLGLYRFMKTESGSTAAVLLYQCDYRLDAVSNSLYEQGRGATSRTWLENFKKAVRKRTGVGPLE